MKRYGRRDGNHADIVAGLRKAGFEVHDCADFGGGFADLLVKTEEGPMLFEVKMPGEKLTEAEEAFSAKWAGYYRVVTSVEDAILQASI